MLHQNRAREVGNLGECDLPQFRTLCGMSTSSGSCSTTGLVNTPVDRLALDPVLVFIVLRLTLDPIYLQIHIYRHLRSPSSTDERPRSQDYFSATTAWNCEDSTVSSKDSARLSFSESAGAFHAGSKRLAFPHDRR